MSSSVSAVSDPINSFSQGWFDAVSFHVNSGKTFFARAQAESYKNSIDLVFNATKNQFSTRPFLNPYSRDDTTCKFIYRTFHSVTYIVQDRELQVIQQENQRVERVLINLNIPRTDESEIYGFSTLIFPISRICKETFPNLKHAQSAFNVHVGSEDFRADYHLQPSSSSSSIYISSK